MGMATPPYKFGDYELDWARHELRRNGRVIKLEHIPLELLLLLAEKGGNMVTRQEISDRLWGKDVFVDTDHGINTAIRKIRTALREDADRPRFVQTVPGKGYRLLAERQNGTGNAATEVQPSEAQPVDVQPLVVQPYETNVQVAQARPDQTSSSRIAIPRRERWIGPLIAAVAVLLAAWYISTRPRVAGPSVQRPLTRLTFDDGLQSGATWSPDSRYIAYSSDRGGKFDIWVQQVSGGDPVQVTHSPGNNWQPDWSPDGKYIAYRSEEGDGGLFIIPALGGQGLEKRIASFGYHPRWSPDGSEIMFRTHFIGIEYQDRFYVVQLGGSPPREVLAEFLTQHNLWAASVAWHPDGKRLTVFVDEPGPSPSIWTVPIVGGAGIKSEITPAIAQELREVAVSGTREEWRGAFAFCWAPSGRAIYFERVYRGTQNIWKLTVDPKTLQGTAIERLTTGSARATEPAVSPDGRRLAFSVKTDNVGLWLLPFNASTGRTSGNPQPLTSPGTGSMVQTLSRDGKKLAFVGLRAGVFELWGKSLVDGREAPIIAGDYERRYPQWSPDGLKLAYSRVNATTGKEQVVLWSSESHTEEPLTTLSETYRVVCDFSPDGKGLLVSQIVGDGRKEVWLLPLGAASHAETAARKIISDSEYDLQQARFSPNGRWIVFAATANSPTAAEATLYVMPATGGQWTRITDSKHWDDKPRWSPDGKTIYFVSNGGGFFNVWGIRFDPVEGKPVGRPFRVTAFDRAALMIFESIYAVGLSVNQDKLVLTMGEVSGSIWMLDNVGP
jgi:Tol biopolymer transport system component/DNA-binding winged helix-turn-helix (wHTH) protein